MTLRPGLSLRQSLPLLISALTASALVVSGALAYAEVRRSSRASAELRLASIAEQVAQWRALTTLERRALEGALAESDVVREALSGEPIDSAMLAAELERLRQPVDGNLPVRLMDAAGTPIFEIGAHPSVTDPNPAPPLESVPTIGPFRVIDDQVLFWRSVPVGSGDTPIGWIAQRRRFRGLGFSTPALLGQGIRVHMGVPEDSVWVELGSGELMPPPRQVDFARAFAYTLGGAPEMLAVARPYEGTTLTLHIEMPMTAVMARPRAFLRRMLWIGGVLLLVVLFLGWQIGGWVTIPLRRLASAADAVSEGNYRQRVELEGGDEMGRVARAFNAMSTRVAETEAALRNRLGDVSALASRLEEANIRAARALEEAQAANQAKSDLLAAVSHEIKTPVSVILAYADLLEGGVANASEEHGQDTEYARRIVESGELLNALVDDLLDLSVVESGELRIDACPTSAREVIQLVLSSQEPRARRKGLTLTSRCPDDATFYADPQRVRQILLNLVSNAMKFTPSGGSVAVTCAHETQPPPHLGDGDRPWLRLTVEDTGIGIAPEELSRVFEPFAQVDRSARGEREPDHAGAGLGLAISRRLSVLMSGDITVESEPGRGSRFSVWLPATREPVGEGAGSASGLPDRTEREVLGDA